MSGRTNSRWDIAQDGKLELGARKMKRLAKLLLAIIGILATAFASPVLAQQSSTPLVTLTTPVVNLVDENHVSLVSGKFELSIPLLNFGDVSFEIHTVNGHLSETQPEDNNQGKVITCLDALNLPSSSSGAAYSETGECSSSIANPTIQAVYGSQRASFYLSNGIWLPEKADGEAFTDTNNGYCTWTQRGGTQIVYYAYHQSSGAPCQSGNIAKIVYPDGRVADYSYYGTISGATRSPILSIATSDGYFLQYNYPATPTFGGESSVTAINRAFQACSPTTSCSTTG
jgi:hypothetical protein